MSSQASSSRCGYVALVGRPNVGKSTLLNHLLSFKISITSRKPQTTRHNVIGVDTDNEYQTIYVDTPGIHDDVSRSMNRLMVRQATSVLSDVDVIVMLVENAKLTDEDEQVLAQIAQAKRPALAALNKVDLLQSKDALLPAIESLRERHEFNAYLPISALRGQGLDALKQEVQQLLPEGPHLFPEDQITDQPQRVLVAELVREKVMRRLGDELPHRTAVLVEAYQDLPQHTEIHALIYVERPGQKRIVIGEGGKMLKSIGQDARRDIERLIDRKVMLHLWVKVRRGWTNDNRTLRELGIADPERER